MLLEIEPGIDLEGASQHLGLVYLLHAIMLQVRVRPFAMSRATR
jgi:hypothetical protein